jgi:hypothetical protein
MCESLQRECLLDCCLIGFRLSILQRPWRCYRPAPTWYKQGMNLLCLSDGHSKSRSRALCPTSISGPKLKVTLPLHAPVKGAARGDFFPAALQVGIQGSGYFLLRKGPRLWNVTSLETDGTRPAHPSWSGHVGSWVVKAQLPLESHISCHTFFQETCWQGKVNVLWSTLLFWVSWT